jgi:hypothetical protein
MFIVYSIFAVLPNGPELSCGGEKLTAGSVSLSDWLAANVAIYLFPTF